MAERAGLSKGGLLYNFRAKADLLEALVDRFVEQKRAALEGAEASNSAAANAAALAYLDVFRSECAADAPPPSGILAAIAENPRFIDPVRRFSADFVERLRRESADPELAVIAYLAVEGLRLSGLLETDPLKPQEREAVLARLGKLLG